MADETTTETTGGGDAAAPVPYHRFKEVNDQLKALRAKVADLEPKAGEADALRRKLDEAKDIHKAQLADLSTHLTMADAGLTDPLGREVANLVYGKLPADGRPAMGDWLRGLRSEGADVPPPLRPYLTSAQQAAQVNGSGTATTTAGETIRPASTATQTTGRAPPAGGNVTAQAIQAAEREFKRTGDQAAYVAKLRELKVIA